MGMQPELQLMACDDPLVNFVGSIDEIAMNTESLKGNHRSHCKFSSLMATHYLKQRRGEFLNLPTEFMLSDHTLYSHDFSE